MSKQLTKNGQSGCFACVQLAPIISILRANVQKSKTLIPRTGYYRTDFTHCIRKSVACVHPDEPLRSSAQDYEAFVQNYLGRL
eukprot:4819299-Pleurochrysis_carterae.AAC.2